MNAWNPSGHKSYAKPSIYQQAYQEYMFINRKRKPTAEELATAEKNRQYNNLIIKKIIGYQSEGGYYTNQNLLEDVKFGISNMKAAGCEVIAMYNASNKLELAYSLPTVIYKTEMSGALMLRGGFGTNSYSLGRIMSKFGIKNKMISYRKLRKKPGNKYVISVWNSDNSVKQGIHTALFEVSPQKQIISYNYHYSTGAEVHNKNKSFVDIFINKPIIAVYKITGKAR